VGVGAEWCWACVTHASSTVSSRGGCTVVLYCVVCLFVVSPVGSCVSGVMYCQWEISIHMLEGAADTLEIRVRSQTISI
jgi:hypothetical protein